MIKKMAVRIKWHRQWAINRPISGLCEKDGVCYWFEWANGIYKAFSLTDETLKKLDEEVEELVASYGKVIFHDERFLPELPSSGQIAKVVKVTEIDLSRVEFSFDSTQISNLIPHHEYYAAKRGITL